MSKSFRHYKKTLKRRIRRKKTRRQKGGNDEKVLCCICEKTVPIKDTLIPRECLNKYFNAAHRICQNCWWNEFALEGVSHKCPGCVKGLPLTHVKKTEPIFIDLTEN